MITNNQSTRATVSLASHAENAPRRLAKARRHERRRALIIVSASLLVAALGIAIAIALRTFERAMELGDTSPSPEDRPRGARVVDELSGRCQVFDNRTGGMSLAKACDEEMRDNYGIPKPVGTIRRLDAISKSFSAH